MGRGDDGVLLVNYWYANPVGHAVEALRYCLGYHRANPALRISLVLNSTTATELASYCPFVETTYAVDFGFHEDRRDPGQALSHVPRDWDYVVDDPRGHAPHQLDAFEGLRRYYEASRRHFRARSHVVAGAEPPRYEAHHPLRLDLDADSRERALRRLSGASVAIALMPAGSGRRPDYPSVKSWIAITDALSAAYSSARFYLVGRLTRDGRTRTRIERREVDRIAAACPASVDGFEDSLADQLAVVEACDLFVSPHTGFGMAALAVGTPWLAISGGRWPEYFFNGVPFYSVLPDPARYPAFTREGAPSIERDEDGEGVRAANMTYARIRGDLPEIVEGARMLIEKRLPYERALSDHFSRLLALYAGDRSRVSSFDAIHERYL